MTEKQRRIQALLQSIIQYLEAHRGDAQGVNKVLNKLSGMALFDTEPRDVTPNGTRHDDTLQRAINNITKPQLLGMAHSLAAAKDDLSWQEDNGLYYAADADLGEGYKNGNVHTLLIGPGACGYHHPDFLLSVFMLCPRTLYRDHNHAAPELYLNLSDRSGWRFDTPDWQDCAAGSLIWNPANAPHATRVYDQPFLSVVVWLKDTNSRCNVIPRDDWAEIEKALRRE